MEKSSSVFFFDEMRLKRSLRPLRLLRLLRSLRPLRFLMPSNHSVCKVYAVFLLLEAKEAVEVIEASDVIMMHYWQEVLKVMEITGRNPSSRIKDSQIRGRSPSIWEFFFLLRGLKPVISNYL